MPEPPLLRTDPQDRPRAIRPPARRPPRRHGGWLTMLALAALWGLILGGGVIGYFALTLPDTSQLAVAERRPNLTILAADGSAIATYGDLFGRPLMLQQMSPDLPEAVIATEDRRFYSNFGIDPVGMLRAAIADLRAGRIVEGGSTITQQLAKILFLTPERSIARKIRETLLALWLDHRFTKNQILEIYLNRVYLGAGTYGVDAAAHRYFGKSAADLDLYESAVIAGLLKAPSLYSPARDRAAAAMRAGQVLDNMVEAGFITRAREAAAERHGTDWAGAGHAGSRYFADWIADQVHDFAGAADRDLIVETTLDPRLQQAAEAAIGDMLARDGARDRVSQGALVTLTPDGAVRAMVGGRDYGQSQFNRVTEAARQPGSAFKPFVYLAGLEAGLRPDDVFDDAPIRIGNWQPHDYGRRYRGAMTLASALANSVNTIAVRVAETAGIDHVIAVANRLGITSTLPHDASIALGTADVTLLELTAAYAPFANGGDGVIPYGIREIRDRAGNVVYRREGSGPGPVVAPAFVGLMNDMLAGVIADGTGRAAALPQPAAGKTGTTQDYRDAWFIGYTARLITGVWFGNDNDAPMRRVIGGSLPAATWRDFMLTATQGLPAWPLPDTTPATPPASTAAATESPFARLLGWIVGASPGPAAPLRFPAPPAQN
jgi:penicillin-binding protein 1A